MDHIRLAEWGDWLLICPATANTIAKMAHGVADNLLTTLSLCFGTKTLVVPAMNSAMWLHPATCGNVEVLEQRGVHVTPVDSGELACGTSGPGRMIPLESVVTTLTRLLGPRPLSGKRVLISSGPTEEPLDPVRVLTNRSSGRMGAALAEAARDMGAEVTVVTGPAAARLPHGVEQVSVRTALQMQAALEQRFDRADICVMAAAVADYRPERAETSKIARESTGPLTLKMVPNPDIVAALGNRKSHQFLVGFALESESGTQRASRKMARKHCDMLVLNYTDSSLGLATSQATILFTDKEPEELPSLSKADLARRIFTRIASRMGLADE